MITVSSAISLMILAAPWLLFGVIVIGALWQAYRRHSHHINNQRGVVLILSLLIMTILLIMGVTFLQIALRESQIAANYRNHTASFYAAEAGLESGMTGLRTLLAGTKTPTQVDLDGIAPAALTSPLYTFTGFQVDRLSDFLIPSSVSQGVYAGLQADATDYLITAQVAGPIGSRSTQTQVVRYLEIPLFQFGVFYGRGVDLEIAPGPSMTFNGRVHANGDMYLSNDSLKFDSQLTTAGNIYRYLKRDPGNRGSNPWIKDGAGVYQQLNFDHDYDVGFSSPWPVTDWRNQATSTYGDNVQDSAMGVQEIIPPIPAAFYDPNNPDISAHQMIEMGQVGDTQELKDAKLYYQADLRIEDGAAYAKDGTPVDLSGCPGAVTSKTFFDGREQRDVVTTDVDIQALESCGKSPANGILYVHQSDVSGDLGSVRLINGAVLPAGGLTVASDNPIYIQGDYNQAGNVSAAVLGDAITVLSANWNDADGAKPTATRPATAIEINAAFGLGPSAESVNGQGNGQLENLIRFLEDWGGQDFTYKGSLVAMWHSMNATADWRCCGSGGNNYYNPPNRLWSYDSNFDTSPPPGTPRGIYVGRGRWAEVR